MQCPKCRAAMEQVEVEGTVVDRCTGCAGLWFDMLEHEDLKPHAARIDTGDAKVGQQHNAIDRIVCPACQHEQPLIRMVDPQQPHIWFESCTVCYGRFYDAGEFRDFAEFGVRDWLKWLKVTPRPD